MKPRYYKGVFDGWVGGSFVDLRTFGSPSSTIFGLLWVKDPLPLETVRDLLAA